MINNKLDYTHSRHPIFGDFGGRNNGMSIDALDNIIVILQSQKDSINSERLKILEAAQDIIKNEKEIAVIEIAKGYCLDKENIFKKEIIKQQNTFPNNRLVVNQLKKYFVGLTYFHK